jgi:hypothetical protein
MKLKTHLVSIAAFVVVLALIAAITATPVAAAVDLTGPTVGSEGDKLTYTYTHETCAANPKGEIICTPTPGTVHFVVTGPTGTKEFYIPNVAGGAKLEYTFTPSGDYFIGAALGVNQDPKLIHVTIFPVVKTLFPVASTSGGAPSGGAPSGAASASPSGGGLGLPALPALPNLLGQGGQQNATAGVAAESAGAAGAVSSAWPWLLAIAIIILLAIIAAVLLLRRRGEEERYEGRGHERRYRRR